MKNEVKRDPMGAIAIPDSPAHRFLGGAWLALITLMIPAVAHANVGPPSSGGHVVAEPVGVVGVDITRETLTIDLRPLAGNGLARVEVVYHLRNPGSEKKLDRPIETGSSWLDRHAWPESIGLGVAWGFAVLVTGMFATFSPDWVLPAGQASHYGYGQALAMFGVFFLSVLALPVGFAIAQLTAVVARRRELARACRATTLTAGQV